MRLIGSVQISDSIPLPAQESPAVRYYDAIKGIAAGESFFVPEVNEDRIRTLCYYGSYTDGKWNNKEFVFQCAVEEGVAGCRIWRVA